MSREQHTAPFPRLSPIGRSDISEYYNASGGTDDPLECSMVCLDDVVEVFADAMLTIVLMHT